MLAQNVAPKPAALPPAAQPSQPANTAGGPSFAQFMTVQASLPAAHADAEPSAPEAAPEPAPASQNPATRRANAQPAKPPAQARPAESAKADAKAAPADKTDAKAATDAVADDADEDDAPDTPQLKEFTQLLGMNAVQPESVAKPDVHRGRAAADKGDDTTPGRPALQAATADKGRAADQPEAAAAKPADLRADKSSSRAATTDTLQAITKQITSDAPAAAPAPAAPSFAAALAQAMPTPTVLPDVSPATTYAAVQAPLHADAFAPELGARISLLAVDGVQQAELQLNPADMGPVSVQITVDGNQAQVSFHALQAETRQALEQSLPDLAAALQSQGLTLSGGGVFQQARRDTDHGEDGQNHGGTTRSSRGGGDRIGGTAGASAAPLRRTVGLVDTFA